MKDFVIQKGRSLCWTLYIRQKSMHYNDVKGSEVFWGGADSDSILQMRVFFSSSRGWGAESVLLLIKSI